MPRTRIKFLCLLLLFTQLFSFPVHASVTDELLAKARQQQNEFVLKRSQEALDQAESMLDALRKLSPGVRQQFLQELAKKVDESLRELRESPEDPAAPHRLSAEAIRASETLGSAYEKIWHPLPGFDPAKFAKTEAKHMLIFKGIGATAVTSAVIYLVVTLVFGDKSQIVGNVSVGFATLIFGLVASALTVAGFHDKSFSANTKNSEIFSILEPFWLKFQSLGWRVPESYNARGEWFLQLIQNRGFEASERRLRVAKKCADDLKSEEIASRDKNIANEFLRDEEATAEAEAALAANQAKANR